MSSAHLSGLTGSTQVANAATTSNCSWEGAHVDEKVPMGRGEDCVAPSESHFYDAIDENSNNDDDESQTYHSAQQDDCESDTSSMTSSNNQKPRRRVSFANELVCDIWERPRTLPQDRTTLFYTSEEIRTFRRECRELVRRKLAERREREELALRLESYSSSTSNFVRMWMNKASQFATTLTSISDASGGMSSRNDDPPETLLLVDTLYLF